MVKGYSSTVMCTLMSVGLIIGNMLLQMHFTAQLDAAIHEGFDNALMRANNETRLPYAAFPGRCIHVVIQSAPRDSENLYKGEADENSPVPRLLKSLNETTWSSFWCVRVYVFSVADNLHHHGVLARFVSKWSGSHNHGRLYVAFSCIYGPQVDGSVHERDEYPFGTNRYTTSKVVQHARHVRDTTNLFDVVVDSEACDEGVVLYLEDDYVMCPGWQHHVARGVSMLDRYPDEISVIRMTYGFSGILMQCRDLSTFSAYVRSAAEYEMEHEKGDRITPPDWSMPICWSGRYTKDGSEDLGLIKPGNMSICDRFIDRRALTYRYAIAYHGPAIASLNSNKYNDGSERAIPWRHTLGKCYDPIGTLLVHLVDHFQFDCRHLDFSPCGSAVVQAMGSWQVDTMFKGPQRSLGTIVPKKGDLGESCRTICSRYNLGCDQASFPIINNCELMQSIFECRVCVLNHYSLMEPTYNWDEDECSIFPHRNPGLYSCHRIGQGSMLNLIRLCPCTPLNVPKLP